MEFINAFGFIIILLLLVPSLIITTIDEKLDNYVDNEYIVCISQIGKLGSIIFMILKIPGTIKGYWFSNGNLVEIVITIVLLVIYYMLLILCKNRESKIFQLAYYMIPGLIFLVSGILNLSYLLIISSLIYLPITYIYAIINIKQEIIEEVLEASTKGE